MCIPAQIVETNRQVPIIHPENVEGPCAENHLPPVSSAAIVAAEARAFDTLRLSKAKFGKMLLRPWTLMPMG